MENTSHSKIIPSMGLYSPGCAILGWIPYSAGCWLVVREVWVVILDPPISSWGGLVYTYSGEVYQSAFPDQPGRCAKHDA